MKKTILLFNLLLIAVLFCNCNNDDDNDSMVDLPATIVNYLSDNYPDYSIDESSQETLCDGTAAYEVELEDSNDNEVELTFDTEGNLLFAEVEIETSDLPSVISSSITTNYADYSIEEAEQLDMFDGSTQYEVEIKNGNSNLEVLLGSDGTVICEQEDTDD